MAKSYSDVRYVAVAVASGEVLTEPTSYASAAICAFSEEMARRDAIDDVEFATREECAAAVDDCEVVVRFHSAERRR